MSVRIVVLEIVEFGLDKISPGMKRLFGFWVLSMAHYPPPKKNPPNWIWAQVYISLLGLKQILLKALLRLVTLLRAC